MFIETITGTIKPKQEPTLAGDISAEISSEGEDIIVIAKTHPGLSLPELVSNIDQIGREKGTHVNDRLSLLAAYLTFRGVNERIIARLTGIQIEDLGQNQIDVNSNLNLGVQLVMVHSKMPFTLAGSKSEDAA